MSGIQRSVAILLVLLLLSALATAQGRLLTADAQQGKDGTLACVTSAVRGPSGEDLRAPAMSVLRQRRFNSVQSSVASQGEAACLRMKVHCVDDNNKQHCTAADYASSAWRMAYMLTTTNVCAYYKNIAAPSGVVSDVYCCTSDNCNADQALESVAKAQESQLGARVQP